MATPWRELSTKDKIEHLHRSMHKLIDQFTNHAHIDGRIVTDPEWINLEFKGEDN